MRAVVVVCVGLGLAGCATRYQEMGPTGGVTAAQITDDLHRISARGNLHTDAGTIQDFVLLKAAETTVAAGRTHFAIVGKQDARGSASQGLYSRSALGATREHFGFGLIGGDRREPGEDLMIRVLPTTLSTEDRAEAIDARQIIANVGGRVKRPEP
ncbi:MAG: hypothetical protein OEL76_15205 [Siculibacillus sp.]|nr:hypothetical protein [Siculibacillus sp.]